MKILEQIKRQVEEIMRQQKQAKITKPKISTKQKNIRRKLSTSSLEQGHKSPRTEEVQHQNPLTENVLNNLTKQASYKIIEQQNQIGGEFRSQTSSFVKYLNTMIVTNSNNEREIVPIP